MQTGLILAVSLVCLAGTLVYVLGGGDDAAAPSTPPPDPADQAAPAAMHPAPRPPERIEHRADSTDMVQVLAKDRSGRGLAAVAVLRVGEDAPLASVRTGPDGAAQILVPISARPASLVAWRKDLEFVIAEVGSKDREATLTMASAPQLHVRLIGADFPRMAACGARLFATPGMLRNKSNAALTRSLTGIEPTSELLADETQVACPWAHQLGTSVALCLQRAEDSSPALLQVRHLDVTQDTATFDVSGLFRADPGSSLVVVHAPLDMEGVFLLTAWKGSTSARGEVLEDTLDPYSRTLVARIPATGLQTVEIVLKGKATFKFADVPLNQDAPAVLTIQDTRELLLDVDFSAVVDCLPDKQQGIVLDADLMDSHGWLVSHVEQAIAAGQLQDRSARLRFGYVMPGPMQVVCTALSANMGAVLLASRRVLVDVKDGTLHAVTLSRAGLLWVSKGEGLPAGDSVEVTVRDHASGEIVRVAWLAGRRRGIYLPVGTYDIVTGRGEKTVELGKEAEVVLD